MTSTLTSYAQSDTRTSRQGPSVARRLLMVSAGGHEWALKPEQVRGVYQLTHAQNAAALKTVSTPEGELPVVSLARELANQLSMTVRANDSERALAVFRHRGQSIAIRLQAVSRPVELSPNQFFALPAMAHPHDDAGILDSLAMVQPESSDPSQALRLVVNPLALLGLQTEPGSSRSANTGPAQVTASPGGTKPGRFAGRGHGQLLTFRPYGVEQTPTAFQFCLPLSAIAEVLTPQPIAKLPLHNPLLLGFLIWRSKPVPVVDLAAAFGVASCNEPTMDQQARESRLLIVRGLDGKHVAVPTLAQMQTIKTPEATAISFSALDQRPHLGVFATGSGRLVVPDLHRILQ